jgi:hypothetical protein
MGKPDWDVSKSYHVGTAGVTTVGKHLSAEIHASARVISRGDH